jgi:hypothetical protein
MNFRDHIQIRRVFFFVSHAERLGFIDSGKFAHRKTRFHQTANGKQKIARPVAQIRPESDVSYNFFRFHFLNRFASGIKDARLVCEKIRESANKNS